MGWQKNQGNGGWGQGMTETKSMGGGEVVGKMVGEMRVGEALQAQEKRLSFQVLYFEC